MLGIIKDKLKLSTREERKDALPLPPGLLFVSCSHDGALRCWDERGRCALSLTGHERAVYAVTNLPDGRVASGGADNSIRIWNLRTGKCETVIRGHSDSVFCLRVLFADPLAAAAAATAAAAAPSGAVAATAARPVPAFRLISGSSDKTVRVWNSQNYKCEATLTGHSGSVLSLVQLSENLLATGSLDKTIRIWNIERNKCELTLQGHVSSVSGLAMLDGPFRLASCSYDETIKIWQLHIPNSPLAVSAAASTAASHAAAGGSEGAMAPAASPPADLSVASWKLERSIRGHTSAIMSILHLPASSAFPQRLVTCSRDLNIKVWVLPSVNLADGSVGLGALRCISNLTGHRNDINALTVLADQRTLVSASSDCMMKTFDLAKLGSVSISELSITNTNPDGKGYTVYSVAPIPESKRTLAPRHVSTRQPSDSSLGGGALASAAAVGNAQQSHLYGGQQQLQQQQQLHQNQSRPGSAQQRKPIAVAGNGQKVLLPSSAQQHGGAASVLSNASPSSPGGAGADDGQQQPQAAIKQFPRSASRDQLAHGVPRTNEADAAALAAAAAAQQARGSVVSPTPSVEVMDPSPVGLVSAASSTLTSASSAGSDVGGGKGSAATDSDDSELDLDEDEKDARSLTLKHDSALAPSLRRVIQKYRLKHYLNYGNLMEEGWYDDGGVVFVTTSHVPAHKIKSASSTVAKAAAAAASAAAVKPAPKINLNQRLSYASPVIASPPSPQPQQVAAPQSRRASSDLPPRDAALLPSSSTGSGVSSGSSTSSGGSSSRFKPFKQWSEEIIVLDSRWDQTLRSTIDEAKRLLASVSEPRARVMALALFVSNKMGGGPRDIVKEWETTIAKLAKVYGKGRSGSGERLVLPIGSLIGRVGLSRHRALLFKYLCDQTVLFPEAWAPPIASAAAAAAAQAASSSNSSSSATHFSSFTPTNSQHQHGSVVDDAASAQLLQHQDLYSHTAGNTDRDRAEQLSVGAPHAVLSPLRASPSAPTGFTHMRGVSSGVQAGLAPSADAAAAAAAGSPEEVAADAEVERTNSRGLRTYSYDDGLRAGAGGAAAEGGVVCTVSPDERTASRGGIRTQPSSPMPGLSGANSSQPSADVQYPSIHCRLMRGQYEYHFPRSASRRRRRQRGEAGKQRTWEESWSDQEAGYSRHQEGAGSSKTFHAWVVVELAGAHYVVDLSYEPSQLYLESSKEAAHYNRGRLGDVRKTGLTAAPLRSLHEIAWHELTDLVLLRDGGFGRVERANYRGLEVVVKTPLSLDTYILKTFMEEAQVLNLLSHPNIVKLIGVCTEKKAIVLDWVRGGDLHTFLKTQAALRNAAAAKTASADPTAAAQLPAPAAPAAAAVSAVVPSSGAALLSGELPLLERLDLCIQTAIGMMYLQWSEPMITHRDLKTLNLLISTVAYNADELSPAPAPKGAPQNVVYKRVIKVCDFGLARNQHHIDGISTQHKDVGTPAFQSPEQWRDDEEERLTTATDVYSFGGIMMEVLTDKMPWHGMKSKYQIYNHVIVERKAPPILDAHLLHPKLIELISACHQFEPAARPTFPDVLRVLREVADELEEESESKKNASLQRAESPNV